MTANPSKPKRHPLPRLWMQLLTDTLLVARHFEIRVNMPSQEVIEAIQKIEQIPLTKDKAEVEPSTDLIKFIIQRKDDYGKEEAFITGNVKEENNMLLTVVSGTVYPNPMRVYTLMAHIMLGIPIIIVARGHWLISILLLWYFARIISLVIDSNGLRRSFTDYLQTAASQRVPTHDR
jgi:hypothetical protein